MANARIIKKRAARDRRDPNAAHRERPAILPSAPLNSSEGDLTDAFEGPRVFEGNAVITGAHTHKVLNPEAERV